MRHADATLTSGAACTRWDEAKERLLILLEILAYVSIRSRHETRSEVLMGTQRCVFEVGVVVCYSHSPTILCNTARRVTGVERTQHSLHSQQYSL